MIGYDRPLRPEWIKKVHELWKPNMLLADFKQPFNEIAWQVEGEEARRKARTVLLRYFVPCEGKGNGRRTLQQDEVVDLSKQEDLETLKPLYLSIILAEVEVIQRIVDFFSRRYKVGDVIEVSDFTKFIKREYGDRDVIRRSVSSFLKTLFYFGVLQPLDTKSYQCYTFIEKLVVKDKIFSEIIYMLFARGRKRAQLELEEMEADPILIFFDLGDLQNRLKTNTGYWTLSKRIGSERITFIT